jgi:hypothetical protein
MKSCLVATYHEDWRTIVCSLTGYIGRTRHLTKKQYRKAIANGALMVFVRDEQKEILRSYIFLRADEDKVPDGVKEQPHSKRYCEETRQA